MIPPIPSRPVGITGGVGTGKSVFLGLMAERGLAGIDTDAVARELVVPGSEALEEIREAFGPGVIDARGRLDREALADRVFAHPGDRKRLEAILHPRIRRIRKERAAVLGERGRVLVAIPLLYEIGAASEFDQVVCVACSPGEQRRRLQARGWSAAQIAGRLEAQLGTAEKMERADRVVWTGASMDMVRRQADILAGEWRNQGGT